MYRLGLDCAVVYTGLSDSDTYWTMDRTLDLNRYDLMGKDKRMQIFELEYREIIKQMITALNLIHMIQL